jgi:N-acetylglucosamine-6-phosphate deacetylase
MIVLSGASVILPDRVLAPGTVVVDGDRIADVVSGENSGPAGATQVDCRDAYIAPGFIDVHVHGVEGMDSLDGRGAIAGIAVRLSRFGVTAFCPTSIACAPEALRSMLADVRAARTAAISGARVLPAHLESNFINPDYCGAQPVECLRLPRGPRAEGTFCGEEILHEIEEARPDVGIVTVAPELDGVIELVRDLASHGHRVSLGHSGASYDEALEAIAAGARHATHLFNRMTPLAHRSPGLAAAVLDHEDVAAEIICDGVHVHPAMVRLAISAKQPARIMAITDGTAGSGLPRGARATLGGRPITVGDAAYLDDGTIAGSVLTMDRAFAMLVTGMGIPLTVAATICSTTPARSLNLHGFGVISAGAVADLVVLDRDFQVRRTFVGGRQVWPGSS